MGVEILLQHQMTKIHRGEPAGRTGARHTAMEVDNWYQPKFRTLNIRARKGIVVATGDSAGNPVFRTMFDVRLTAEYQAENSEWTERDRRWRDRRHGDRGGARATGLPDHPG